MTNQERAAPGPSSSVLRPSSVVLGIDPGTARLGYGVVHGSDPYRALAYGCVHTAAGTPLPHRLRQLYEALLALVDEHRPGCMAVEQLFFSRNATTALAVGQARGVALLAAATREVPVAEYTPLQVKLAVSGFGRADKGQMQRMVQALLDLPELPRPDDAADALAVALCHVGYARLAALQE